jgi:membrane-associated phospholipid phosphatase
MRRLIGGLKISASVFATLLIVTTASFKAHAATEPDSVAELPSSSENLIQKFYRDLYSPFVNPTTLATFAGGTVSTLTLFATHKDFEDKLLEDTANEKPLGEFSQVGDIMGQMVPNVAYTAWFAGRYFITKDPLAAFRAEMMFRATLSSAALSTFLKLTVREPRPKSDQELTSFPSGHSTSIFAFATAIAAMHGRYWGLGAYTLATFVAVSRMNDNRHRLHDVLAGATIGSIYGLAIYDRMSENALLPTLKTARRYEVIPIVTDGGAMLSLAGSF